MALTRKMLSAMGIEADKIEQIIEAHTETITGVRGDADKYHETADKLKSVQKELDDLKKATAGKDYDALKKEYEDFKAEVAEKETKAAKEKAYREALKDANLNEKGIEKALKYANWSGLELDEDGKLKEAKAHIKEAKEEWAEYVVKGGTQGAQTPNPPANTGGNGKTKEEIMKIADTAERQKAIAENHELFGF